MGAWPLTSSTTTHWSPPSSSTPTRCAIDDGDEVVDPPEDWIEAEDHETLDERLAEETPDVSPGDIDPRDADDTDDESIVLTPDDELDRIDPQQHGRKRGQIDGAPEDGNSFFDVVE